MWVDLAAGTAERLRDFRIIW